MLIILTSEQLIQLILFQFYLQSSVTLCNLGVGATFGESVLHDLPRDSTVVTKTTCELLRVEQQDFRLIWEVSSLEMTRAIQLRLRSITLQGLWLEEESFSAPDHLNDGNDMQKCGVLAECSHHCRKYLIKISINL